MMIEGSKYQRCIQRLKQDQVNASLTGHSHLLPASVLIIFTVAIVDKTQLQVSVIVESVTNSFVSLS